MKLARLSKLVVAALALVMAQQLGAQTDSFP